MKAILKNNINKVIILKMILSGSISMALPTIYPTDPTRLSTLANGTNSNLIMDDVDDRRVYVMPPNTAMARSQGLHTINANIGFCGEVADIQKYSRSIAAKIKELEMNTADNAGIVKKIQKQLAEARVAMSEYASSKNLLALTDLDNRIKDLEDRLNSIYKIEETCGSKCPNTSDEIRDVNIEKTKLLRDRRVLASKNTEDVRGYEKLKSKVEQITLNLNDASSAASSITARLTAVKGQLIDMYSSFGKMEGARAAFIYTSDWDSNISSLRTANPGISFEKIQTQNAKLHSSLIGLNPIMKSGAILGYEVPGNVSQDGVLNLPAYPENFSANIVLSLLGLCPLKFPENFSEGKTMPSEKDMKYGLTIAFDYPSNFKLSVKAKYNMHKMYQKVISSGSSGGFFSSRSWSNVSESTDFSDAFKVEWKEQDPSNAVTNDERTKVEQDLKTDIFTRMAVMAMPNSPDRNGMIAARAPPVHGAVVISDSLMKACPGNVDCVGGALVMNVLDSIFGNSSAVAAYTQTQDVELIQTWSKDKVSLKPWITTYTDNN